VVRQEVVALPASRLRPVNGFSLSQLLLALAGLLFMSLAVPAWVAVRVNQARIGRAERDVTVIAEAIQRFERDNGFLPAWTRASSGGPGPAAERVDLLVGPGAMPRVADGAGVGWRSGRTDALERQLIDNAPGYTRPSSAERQGWQGPYLPAPPTADPWGNRYLVIIGAAGGQVESPGVPGAASVISAGPNGVLETPYQTGGVATLPGDDIGVRFR